MARPLLVFENIDAPHRHLFTLNGISVEATPLAWIGPVLTLPTAFILTLIFYPAAGLLSRLGWTLVLAMLMQGVLIAHDLGHIVSSTLAHAPMDVLLLTPFRHLTLYHGDQSQFPPRIHILRAIGGGLGNFTAAIIGIIWIFAFGGSPAVLFWTLINLFVGASAYLPFESVDGATILHYLRGGGKS